MEVLIAVADAGNVAKAGTCLRSRRLPLPVPRKDALRQRKATPAEMARHAERGGLATVIHPYLEAFTADA